MIRISVKKLCHILQHLQNKYPNSVATHEESTSWTQGTSSQQISQKGRVWEIISEIKSGQQCMAG